jgi:beta-glucanase (GH16 family)
MEIKYKILGLLCLLWIGACGNEEDNPQANLPILIIDDIKVQEGDEDTKVVLTLKVSGQNKAGISLQYSTFDGTAKSGINYVAVSNTSLTLAANETQKNIEISLKGNNETNSQKEFYVLFSGISNATLQRDKITITVLDDDYSIPNGYTSPTTRAGYTLTWADEFQSTTLGSHWAHETGASGWGNNELQYYRAENTSILDNEYLLIEAKKESYQGAEYTSSRLITKGKKFFKYGRIDIRALLPKGQGIWPALWMLGENISTVSWPACGEIDIMEIVGNAPNKLHGTAHWDNNGQYASYGGNTTLSSGDFSTQFHVFSIAWNSQKIIWYLDDVQYHEIDITPTDLNEFQKDFFFIFNVAVGGNWPGSPNASTVFPQQMMVDYIRVFQ